MDSTTLIVLLVVARSFKVHVAITASWTSKPISSQERRIVADRWKNLILSTLDTPMHEWCARAANGEIAECLVKL
jgi:hypothetical protein